MPSPLQHRVAEAVSTSGLGRTDWRARLTVLIGASMLLALLGVPPTVTASPDPTPPGPTTLFSIVSAGRVSHPRFEPLGVIPVDTTKVRYGFDLLRAGGVKTFGLYYRTATTDVLFRIVDGSSSGLLVTPRQATAILVKPYDRPANRLLSLDLTVTPEQDGQTAGAVTAAFGGLLPVYTAFDGITVSVPARRRLNFAVNVSAPDSGAFGLYANGPRLVDRLLASTSASTSTTTVTSTGAAGTVVVPTGTTQLFLKPLTKHARPFYVSLSVSP